MLPRVSSLPPSPFSLPAARAAIAQSWHIGRLCATEVSADLSIRKPPRNVDSCGANRRRSSLGRQRTGDFPRAVRPLQQDATASDRMPFFDTFRVESPHNVFLAIAAGAGVAAGVAYSTVLVAIVLLLRSATRTTSCDTRSHGASGLADRRTGLCLMRNPGPRARRPGPGVVVAASPAAAIGVYVGARGSIEGAAVAGDAALRPGDRIDHRGGGVGRLAWRAGCLWQQASVRAHRLPHDLAAPALGARPERPWAIWPAGPGPAGPGTSRPPRRGRPRGRARRSGRFLAKAVARPDGCHLWVGATAADGYGAGVSTTVAPSCPHRWLREQMCGPIPPSLCRRHACDETSCVPSRRTSASAPEPTTRPRWPAAKGAGRWHVGLADAPEPAGSAATATTATDRRP